MGLGGDGVARDNARRRHRDLLFVLLCGGLLTTSTSWAREDAATPPAMQKIFGAVQTLLLTAVDGDRWLHPADPKEIDAAIATLEQMGTELEGHEGDGTATFEFFSRSLSKGTAALASRHREGDSSSAREQLFALVSTCVGCHSRLPSDRDSDLSQRFISDPRIAKLPLDGRAILETATRQFEAALTTYEAILQSPDYSLTEMDRLGIFDDYLALCLQVHTDPMRPHRSLQAISKRAGVSTDLAAHLSSWLADLERIQTQQERPNLADIRSQVQAAEAAATITPERSLLVDYLGSAALAHRLVRDSTRTPLEHAEAYYLLGLVESRVGRVFWPVPEEYYLEVAVRMAPGTDIARKAFALYEELVTLGYSGSGGTRMPPDLVVRLQDLRELSTAPPTAAPRPGSEQQRQQ